MTQGQNPRVGPEAQGQKMSKDQIISGQILAAISGGMSIDQAIDAVLGAGTYIRIAYDLHESLNQ